MLDSHFDNISARITRLLEYPLVEFVSLVAASTWRGLCRVSFVNTILPNAVGRRSEIFGQNMRRR